MIILVEGLDRAGKTTRCRELMAEPRSRPRLMLHFVAPPKGTDRRGASLLVLEEIVTAYGLAAKHPEVDFVLDRGHVSWMVYEEILRENPAHASVVAQVEDAVRGVPTRLEYVEVADPMMLAMRDDGHSTYTPKHVSPNATRVQRASLTVANIEKEVAVFERVLAMSSWPVRRRVTG